MGISNNVIKAVDDGDDSSYWLPLYNKLKDPWKQSWPKKLEMQFQIGMLWDSRVFMESN